jgi:hypothetical protein
MGRIEVVDNDNRVGRDVAPAFNRMEVHDRTRSTMARRKPRLPRCCGSNPR